MMAACVLSKAHARLDFCVVDGIRSCQCSQHRDYGCPGLPCKLSAATSVERLRTRCAEVFPWSSPDEHQCVQSDLVSVSQRIRP